MSNFIDRMLGIVAKQKWLKVIWYVVIIGFFAIGVISLIAMLTYDVYVESNLEGPAFSPLEYFGIRVPLLIWFLFIHPWIVGALVRRRERNSPPAATRVEVFLNYAKTISLVTFFYVASYGLMATYDLFEKAPKLWNAVFNSSQTRW